VRFVGKTTSEAMHTFYADQDVLLAPSLWPESFGLVAREAAAAGLWVLASDRGAIGEGVTHGVDGWVIDVASLDPLMATLAAIDAAPECYTVPPPPPQRPRTAEDQARDLVALYREVFSRRIVPKPPPYFMGKDFPTGTTFEPSSPTMTARKAAP
jgi:glycosyltransferase involved in cell wall biosynthesis